MYTLNIHPTEKYQSHDNNNVGGSCHNINELNKSPKETGQTQKILS